MTAHSSILAWKIPQTGEPGRLQSIGLPKVGHGCALTHTHCVPGAGRPFGEYKEGTEIFPAHSELLIC